jgi:hypothetical protein
MKKYLSIFIVITSMLPLFGGEMETSNPQTSYPVHHITAGGSYTRGYLKPNAQPSFGGNLWGIQAYYEYTKPDFFYGGANFSWRYGHVHASNGKRSINDIDVQERFGYTKQFHVLFDTSLSFFTGLGYRHIRHGVYLNDQSSIKLFYNHFYLPVGILKKVYFNSTFTLGFNAVWMAQMLPTLTITPTDGARWKLQRQFKNFMFELPLIFHLDKYVSNLSIIAKPQLEIWQDGKTTAKSIQGLALDLPENTYIFWGGEVNVKYSF